MPTPPNDVAELVPGLAPAPELAAEAADPPATGVLPPLPAVDWPGRACSVPARGTEPALSSGFEGGFCAGFDSGFAVMGGVPDIAVLVGVGRS